MHTDGIIPGNNSPVINGSLHDADGFVPSIGEPLPTPREPVASLGVISTLVLAAKIICFLPWCITVGAALLLSPHHLDLIAFQTGYLPHVQGVPRFAHWANCGLQHVAIFFAAIFAVGYCNTAVGLALVAFFLVRFVYVWQNFEFDQSIPLGEDDRQSLYRVAMMEACGLDKNTVIYRVVGDNETLRSAIMDGDAGTGRIQSDDDC